MGYPDAKEPHFARFARIDSSQSAVSPDGQWHIGISEVQSVAFLSRLEEMDATSTHTKLKLPHGISRINFSATGDRIVAASIHDGATQFYYWNFRNGVVDSTPTLIGRSSSDYVPGLFLAGDRLRQQRTKPPRNRVMSPSPMSLRRQREPQNAPLPDGKR